MADEIGMCVFIYDIHRHTHIHIHFCKGFKSNYIPTKLSYFIFHEQELNLGEAVLWLNKGHKISPTQRKWKNAQNTNFACRCLSTSGQININESLNEKKMT